LTTSTVVLIENKCSQNSCSNSGHVEMRKYWWWTPCRKRLLNHLGLTASKEQKGPENFILDA